MFTICVYYHTLCNLHGLHRHDILILLELHIYSVDNYVKNINHSNNIARVLGRFFLKISLKIFKYFFA